MKNKNKMLPSLLLALLCWPCLTFALDSKIKDDKVLIVSIDGTDHDFEFPFEIKEFEVISVMNPRAGEKDALIVLVKCWDKDLKTDKWYFQIRGHFGNSIAACELGVAPPPASKIAEIRHLYGDTFGFKLLSQEEGQAEKSWYYVTSCPPSSGKDPVGAFLHPKAQEMMVKVED